MSIKRKNKVKKNCNRDIRKQIELSVEKLIEKNEFLSESPKLQIRYDNKESFIPYIDNTFYENNLSTVNYLKRLIMNNPEINNEFYVQYKNSDEKIFYRVDPKDTIYNFNINTAVEYLHNLNDYKTNVNNNIESLYSNDLDYNLQNYDSLNCQNIIISPYNPKPQNNNYQNSFGYQAENQGIDFRNFSLEKNIKEIDCNNDKLHIDNNEELFCNVESCTKAFHSSYELNTHMKNTHKNWRFICKHSNCKTICKSKSGLNLHVKRRHY